MTKRTKFPPSLNRLHDVGPLNETQEQTQKRQRSNAYRERQREQKRSRSRRLRRLQVLMGELPLKPGLEADIPAMADLFEQTKEQVDKSLRRTPATDARVEKELKQLVSRFDRVLSHIENMHRDSLAAWIRASGTADLALLAPTVNAVLADAWEWSVSSLDIVRRVKSGAKRGRKSDKMADAMRDTAAEIYRRLTGEPSGRFYDAIRRKERLSRFGEFLKGVFEVYEIPASAMSRSRKRMGKKST